MLAENAELTVLASKSKSISRAKAARVSLAVAGVIWSATSLIGQHAAQAAVLTWTGATNKNWDDAVADVNWVDGSSNPANYSDGSDVVFTDTAGGLNSGASSSEYVITVNHSSGAGSTTGVAPNSVSFSDNGGGTSGSYAFTNGNATTGITGSTSQIGRASCRERV